MSLIVVARKLNVFASATCLLLGAHTASGQTINPALYQPAANSSGFVLKTKTSPSDDSVLEEAPSELFLEFPQRVRLVKLTLRNAKHDWVDINFRYSPSLGESFAWQLPALATTAYYTADWAILESNDQLVRGSFSFSFGPEAKPPSIEKETDNLLLQLRYGDPSVQSVRPPNTRIIINRDPPQFDPPFTINLDNSSAAEPR